MESCLQLTPMFDPLIATLQKNNLLEPSNTGGSGSLPAPTILKILNSNDFLAVSPKVRRVLTLTLLVSQSPQDHLQHQADRGGHYTVALS